MLHGTELLATEEVRGRLGISATQARNLLACGRINGVKEGGRWWALSSEVEAYGQDQEYWRQLGGRWTPFGRMAKGQRKSEYELADEDRRQTTEDAGQTTDDRPQTVEYEYEYEDTGATTDGGRRTAGGDELIGGERWIRVGEAADIMALHYTTVARLARGGRLVSKIVIEPDRVSGRGHVKHHRVMRIELSSVLRLMADREVAADRRGISPRQWREGSTLKPLIRSKIEAPPGDPLISRSEAAWLLGVTPARVSVLVGKGRLFGWQRFPGKHGCPLWLSERQVLRLSQDSGWQRGHACAKGERPGRLDDWPAGLQTPMEEFMDGHRLAPVVFAEEGPATQRDRGEFFTTRQVGQLLGISQGSVQSLRLTRRLRGYQRRRVPGDGVGKKWWFYRKDDVYALLADSEYRKRHERGKHSRAGRGS